MGLADIALTEVIEGKLTFEKTVGYVVVPHEGDQIPIEEFVASHDYSLPCCEIFSRGWELYKKNACLLVPAFVFIVLWNFVPLIGGVVYFALYCGYAMMIMNGVRSSNKDGAMRFNDIFSCVTLIVPLCCQLFMLSAIYGSMVAAIMVVVYTMCMVYHAPMLVTGIVALILCIPVMYVMLSMAPATYILIEFHTEKIGCFKALSLSFKQVNKHFMAFAMLQSYLALVVMSGMMFAFMGLMFTVPLAMVIDIVAFNRMFPLLTRDYRASNCVVCV